MWEEETTTIFRRVRKIATSDSFFHVALPVYFSPVRPFACNNSAPNGEIIHEIWYFKRFRKFVEKIRISLKYDKNNGYFPGRSMYVYVNLSISFS